MRLVDLDAVIDCIEMEWGYEGIREDLYSLPVVDAVPVVHAKWIPFHSEAAGDIQYCSACDIYLDGAPTLNVETNMRCKDCKHWQRHTGVVDSPNGHCFALETCTNGMDFCSYGEYQTNTGGNGNVSD